MKRKILIILNKIQKIIKKVLGYCDCPCHKRHWFIYPKKFRMNTMYQNEESNWITCCEYYYDNVVEPYWEERWSELRSGY